MGVQITSLCFFSLCFFCSFYKKSSATEVGQTKITFQQNMQLSILTTNLVESWKDIYSC